MYAPGNEGKKEADVRPLEVDDWKLEDPSVNGSAVREIQPPNVGCIRPACIADAHIHESALQNQLTSCRAGETECCDLPVGVVIPTTHNERYPIDLFVSYPSWVPKSHIPAPSQAAVLSIVQVRFATRTIHPT